MLSILKCKVEVVFINYQNLLFNLFKYFFFFYSDANASFTASLNETVDEMSETESLIKSALEKHEQLLSQLQQMELEEQGIF